MWAFVLLLSEIVFKWWSTACIYSFFCLIFAWISILAAVCAFALKSLLTSEMIKSTVFKAVNPLLILSVFSSATPVIATPSSKRKPPLESAHSLGFSNKKRRSVKKNLGLDLLSNTLFSGNSTPASGIHIIWVPCGSVCESVKFSCVFRCVLQLTAPQESWILLLAACCQQGGLEDKRRPLEAGRVHGEATGTSSTGAAISVL